MKLPRLLRGRERRDVGSSSLLENPDVDVTSGLIAESNETSIVVPGLPVNPMRGLRLAAVYASVRAIAESCASLPLPVYRRNGRSRERLVQDPRWRLLNLAPNPEQTAMELLENWFGHALLWGTGYLYVRADDEAPELWPLRPDRTRARRTRGGQLFYETVLDTGERIQLPPEQVIPLRSIFDGLPAVRLARGAIGTAIAAEEYAGHFWSNNSRPDGIIELSGELDDQKYDDFRRRWRAGHEGLKRSHLVGILTGGATWKELGVPPDKAQVLESRQFSVREIARMFRVPPHVIGDLEGTVTRASIEQQSIEFVIYTLRPWLVRAEQALNRRLFDSEADRAAGIYCEFLADGLMRGDAAARAALYQSGILTGWLSRADARELENLPDVPEAGLDRFLIPLNMAFADQPTESNVSSGP